MPRLFVAIDLPEGVKRDLERLRAGVPGANWLRPAQFHLTLRFIGEVDGALARDVAAALAGVDGEGFAMSLAGLGHFGRGRKIHTLWVGARADGGLLALRERIEARLVALGLEPEHRKYKPHVTLARLKEVGEGRLADYLAGHAAFASERFAVDSFALFSSFLGHEGAIHTIESSYPLRPAASAGARDAGGGIDVSSPV